MEDHHVDRPGVEVQQCMELTGTNRSIGLFLLRSRTGRSGKPRMQRKTLYSAGGAPRGCDRASFRYAGAVQAVRVRLSGRPYGMVRPGAASCSGVPCPKSRIRGLAWPGGYSEGETPDPIPNSAVKTLSADGTASQGVGE